MLKRIVSLLVFAALISPAAAWAEPRKPLPFAATYSVIYRGFAAGFLHVELRTEGPDRFVYETRGEPGVITRLVVGSNVVEHSVMHIDEEGVRPLSWRMNHGRLGNGFLDFSWEEGRVAGTFEGNSIDLPVEPGLQDRLSIQIAVITALRRGVEPGTIPMVDGDEIKHYSYTRVAEAPVQLENGEIEAVLYESTRPGSSRLARVWHVPALDYIPIRAEQLRGGRIETVMTLVSIEAR